MVSEILKKRDLNMKVSLNYGHISMVIDVPSYIKTVSLKNLI